MTTGSSRTTYVGHVTVNPPLSGVEQVHLRDSPILSKNGEEYGRPRPPCPWVPIDDGARLVLRSPASTDEAIRWLRWLISHLLAPGARAERQPGETLHGYTFDHGLDGMVVGWTAAAGELVAISVRHNRVRRRHLMPPGGPLDGPAPTDPGLGLPAQRARVIDLASWRAAGG